MHVEVQSRKFQLPASLADQAQHGLHDALDHRSESIQRIVLRIGGTNEGFGSADTYCLIQVHLADARVATVIDIGADAHDVIERATGRMRRTVVEYLDKTA